MCAVESGPMFYAGSLLGINTLGILAWYLNEAGVVRRFWFCWISRIADKSAAYTMVQLQDFLVRCKELGHMSDNITKLHFVSDTGTHFRSYSVLGSMAEHLMGRLKPQIAEIAVMYGPESHAKCKVDGLFPSFAKLPSSLHCRRTFWTTAP